MHARLRIDGFDSRYYDVFRKLMLLLTGWTPALIIFRQSKRLAWSMERGVSWRRMTINSSGRVGHWNVVAWLCMSGKRLDTMQATANESQSNLLVT